MDDWKRPRRAFRAEFEECILTPGRSHILTKALLAMMKQESAHRGAGGGSAALLSKEKALGVIVELQDLLHMHWRQINWRTRCSIWGALALLFSKYAPHDGRTSRISGVPVGEMQVPSLPDFIYPYLVKSRLIPLHEPVFMYSLRTLRNSMHCLQEAIQLHRYHPEMRAYWCELRAHLLHNFFSRQHVCSSASSKLFDDYAWSASTRGGGVRHLSSIGIRSSQAILTGIDVRLAQHERWTVVRDHPLFKHVSDVEASEYAPSVFEVIRGSQWQSDQVVTEIYRTMSSFYEHAGERWELGEEESVKHSLEHEAYSKFTDSLKSQAVISRMRASKAVLVGQFSLPKLPIQVLQDHFMCVSGEQPADEARIDEFSRVHNESYRAFAGYDDNDDEAADFSTLTLRAKLMYVRYTHTFIACMLVKYRLESKVLNVCLRDTVSGMTPSPSSFPAIVQTSDFRVHVAVDALCLVWCPNVESAFKLFDAITAKNERVESSRESGVAKRARLLREMAPLGI